MKEPANFEAFWWCWERRSALKRFRPDFAHVAATFEAVGAFDERQRLIAAGWIEPKPVIPPRPYMSSPDHEPEYVTGLNIPETPT